MPHYSYLPYYKIEVGMIDRLYVCEIEIVHILYFAKYQRYE